jgi:glycosyltransferase involved in cell wall biosynthesis
VKKPLVSIVIPVLNGERDIARCLLSIRNLNFPPEKCEVLVMDNGSTDDTCAIVRDLGFDSHVVPGVHVGTLRNRGVAIAHGDYVGFVDADVELMPCWLHAGLAALEDSRVVAAGCFPRAPRPATWVQQTWEIHQCGAQDGNSRPPVSWLPAMNLLVRRDVFQTVNGFDEQLVTAEDVDLCYRLGKHGTILSVPAMDAIHWGEAANLGAFWRKEVWRGLGNLAGVTSHGLRSHELPSLGYPLYVLCLLVFLVASCIFDLQSAQLRLIPINLALLALPALILAAGTSFRTKYFRVFPKLFLLYLVYGLARAYSVAKEWFREC